MKSSVAIWPSLNGEIRLAADTSDNTSLWRNGGTHGNSARALQLDDEHDTVHLNAILKYLEDYRGAQPLSISHHVVIVKVKLRHLLGALRDICYLLKGNVNYVSIPSRHPKKV